MNSRHSKEPILRRETILRAPQCADDHPGAAAMLYVAMGGMVAVALAPLLLIALVHASSTSAALLNTPPCRTTVMTVDPATGQATGQSTWQSMDRIVHWPPGHGWSVIFAPYDLSSPADREPAP